jgi:hypothetical protein
MADVFPVIGKHALGGVCSESFTGRASAIFFDRVCASATYGHREGPPRGFDSRRDLGNSLTARRTK